MNLSFKNKLAFYYLLATSILMAVVFCIIYYSLEQYVYKHLDDDLYLEVTKHQKEIRLKNQHLQFKNIYELKEKEHIETEINPVFLQITNNKGTITSKSFNLKKHQLPFIYKKKLFYFNAKINQQSIRLIQVPLIYQQKIKGFISIAIPSETAIKVLYKLKLILTSSYFLVLIVLFFISRFLAGRNIIPIIKITNTITNITQKNLSERVVITNTKDEIYNLSEQFNLLLDRLEKAIDREKQFTSDASHELRTPLSVIRGTLEILIRKPRTPEEYIQKINFCLTEIDKITHILEQLLNLARLESPSLINNPITIKPEELIQQLLQKHQDAIKQKLLNIHFKITNHIQKEIPLYYGSLIIENILTNALKYSYPKKPIHINLTQEDNHIIVHVIDAGIGIPLEEQPKIFDNFYRAHAYKHPNIKGNGLGLSIAHKAAMAINANIQIESIPNQETHVTITF